MKHCLACTADVPSGSHFCLKCGSALNGVTPLVRHDGAVGIETVAMEAEASASKATPVPRAPTMERYRFEPGSLIASRYRIISRLGKGGMGEVFRADDILLGQAVALKFLPESAKGNLSLLTRFYDEVRIARQITHANVCRVYDIGEIDGQPYLSMEYIDGEDLASLLRRIGRLPSDKATEFARKLCAGLAAAHAQGVLHRDLKPGNIMIDGRGELRIADFGLAAVAAQMESSEVRHGTPAYMAPEQLEGREVSVQSDLYALGLVFHEMFTGKPPHHASTVAEILKLRKEGTASHLSTIVADLDPAVEKAIKRCLDPDPKKRPASALALSASLPGGDPLAAALAAGETPSPELVAASGTTEGLSPKVAISALLGVAILLIAMAIVIPAMMMFNSLPLGNPPEVLVAKARDIARTLGYDRIRDTAWGFHTEDAQIRHFREKNLTSEQWTALVQDPPYPVTFTYRQHRGLLAARDISSSGVVTLLDPVPQTPGMVSVIVDLDGHLLRFEAASPQKETSDSKSSGPAPPDWPAIFRLANLDIQQFQPATPEWIPLAAADSRLAWTGAYPGQTDLPVRVEAASFEGKPVHFEVIWPWTKSAAASGSNNTPLAQRILNSSIALLSIAVLVAACVVARYNWKARRGDPKGATRIGLYVAGMGLVVWMLRAHHVLADAEGELWGEALADALFSFAIFWIFYLALEPWVRRYWPQTLVTWSRLMQGRWRDPLVGRDVLFAVLLAGVYTLFFAAFQYADMRLNHAAPPDFYLGKTAGLSPVLALLGSNLRGGVSTSVVFFLTLFLLKVLLRKQWIAAVVFVVIFTAMQSRNASPWWVGAILFFVIYSTLVVVLLRFGLFALAVMVFALNQALGAMFTNNFAAWYGQSSWLTLAVMFGLALWGFKVSLAGRPLFTGTALEKAG